MDRRTRSLYLSFIHFYVSHFVIFYLTWSFLAIICLIYYSLFIWRYKFYANSQITLMLCICMCVEQVGNDTHSKKEKTEKTILWMELMKRACVHIQSNPIKLCPIHLVHITMAIEYWILSCIRCLSGFLYNGLCVSLLLIFTK